MSDDEAFEKFKECAVEVLQVPADKVTKEARFAEDLDADSLDLVELVMALEETFDVSVEETELEGHRDHRPGLRPDHRQALMLLGIGPDGPVAGRRVAITGMGVVSCCGIGTDALWAGLNGPPPRVSAGSPTSTPSGWFVGQGGPPARPVRPVQRGRGRHGPGRTPARSTPTRAARVSIMGTGVGGLETLETQILIFGEKGPRRVSPRLVPMMMSNAGAAAVSIRLGWHGPSETVIDSLRGRGPQHRPRRPAGGLGPVRRGHRRCRRSGHDRSRHGRLRQHDRPVHLGDLPALRRPSRRIRHHRGGRRAGPRGVGPRRGPGRPHLRGAGRLGQHGRRPPHHRPHPGRIGGGGLHDPGHGGRRRDPGPDRPHQRPRHLDPAQRPGRGGRHHQGVRRRRRRR